MITTDNIDFDTFKLEIQANSAHNDGWTQQFYKDELKKVKTKKVKPPKKVKLPKKKVKKKPGASRRVKKGKKKGDLFYVIGEGKFKINKLGIELKFQSIPLECVLEDSRYITQQ